MDFEPRTCIKKRVKKTVFESLGNLSKKTDAVSFGQGTLNWGLPEFLKENIHSEISQDKNYTQKLTNADLVKDVAKSYSKFFLREICPNTEILVTAGATAGLWGMFATY